MSKAPAAPVAKPVEILSEGGQTLEGGNEAAPKKARKTSIKYTKIVESSYKPTDNPDAMHPLDKPAITSRGGLKFPGVGFENNVLGIIVKIPARSTIIKNPTVRQLLSVLDELYAK